MKIAFVTNYYNHHQKPLADELFSLVGDDYYFIETAPISAERLELGWGGEERPSYVLQNYTDEASRIRCQEIVDDADVVIIGSAPYSIIKTRLKKGRLTFLYTERLYKAGVPYLKLPVQCLKALKNYVRFKNFYVLCASAYTPIDFARKLSFIGKTYKWGYFTEVKKYGDIDSLISKKTPRSIVWVARFIDWKHPELALEIAHRLKNDGYDFTLNIIGTGDMEEEISDSIEKLGLQEYVKMLGSMPPQEVREHMEKSQIFLMTSDRKEGWGAVLNEAMNSGCAVVANSATGSAPYLINDCANGFLYNENNIEDMYLKVKKLLDNPNLVREFGEKAYYTITEQWNAENAAERFLELCENLLSGDNGKKLFKNGVCSNAYPIKDNWYKVKNGEL